MFYVEKTLDDASWNGGFRAAAADVGLDTVAVTATRMCQLYLGLSDRITWCRGAEEELCDALMDSIFSSGNFGRKRGADTKLETVATRIKRKGVIQALQMAGESNWEAYHRHPKLKPFAWIYQIGRYAKQGIQLKRGGGRIKEDFERGAQRAQLLQRLMPDRDGGES